jgi:hypothetical protein
MVETYFTFNCCTYVFIVLQQRPLYLENRLENAARDIKEENLL